LPMTPENIELWCYEGWVDLREKSWLEWKDRINKIIQQATGNFGDTTGSRHYYNASHWSNFDEFDEGKIVGWVFENEDKGARWKR
jgi:hypothetical protein